MAIDGSGRGSVNRINDREAKTVTTPTERNGIVVGALIRIAMLFSRFLQPSVGFTR